MFRLSHVCEEADVEVDDVGIEDIPVVIGLTDPVVIGLADPVVTTEGAILPVVEGKAAPVVAGLTAPVVAGVEGVEGGVTDPPS